MNGMSSETISTTVYGEYHPSTLEVGVVDVDLRLSRLAVLGDPPVGRDGAAEIKRVAVGEVLCRNPVVVLANELRVGGGRFPWQALGYASAQFLDQLTFEVASLDGHLNTDSFLSLRDQSYPSLKTRASPERKIVDAALVQSLVGNRGDAR